MAFISAPVPWQTLVATFAPDMEEAVRAAGVDAVVAVRGHEVVAVLATGDRRDVWRVACEIASMWPGLLLEADVGLRVVTGAVTVVAPARAMADPVAMGEDEWLAACTVALT